jgi:hypothetical protein
MTMRVVGAGVGRTGTLSLKTALEQLLGGRCYHAVETVPRPEDLPVWEAAARGDFPEWRAFLGEFSAVVDWPAAGFWPELTAAFPEAIVLLSTRTSAEEWWRSASSTIFAVMDRRPSGSSSGDDAPAPQRSMINAVLGARFTPEFDVEGPAKAAYDTHNAAVRAAVPPERLVEWQPGDGWAPICAALELPVPDAPFPHVNSTRAFRDMAGLDSLDR